MTDVTPFGFRVKHHEAGSRYPGDQSPEGWNVSLPHQCDRWDIAGEAYVETASHAEAVAELERFLAEGQEALAALTALQDYGADD